MSPARHHRRRRLGAILAVGSALAIGIGVIIGNQTTGGGGPPPGPSPVSSTLANEWMSTTAGSSPRRIATAGTFTDPAGCNSTCAYGDMKTAYLAASCGDNILLNTGAYASQDIFGTSRACSAASCREAVTYQDGSTSTLDTTGCVTFSPASGATVTVGTTTKSIALEVPFVRLYGLTLPTAVAQTGPYYGIAVGPNLARSGGSCATNWDVHDIILQNVTASLVAFTSTSYGILENSTLGPSYATSSSSAFQVRGCSQTTVTHPDHIVMQNTVVGPLIQDGSQSTFHSECSHWEDGSFGVFKNNIFKDCAQQAISVQPELVASPAANNMLIEGNVFGKACETNPFGFCSVVSGGTTVFICQSAGPSMQNVTVRFNSYDGTGGGPSLQSGCGSMGPFTFTGNIIPTCPSASGVTVSYDNNVTAAGTCTGTNNTTSTTIQPIYVSPLSANYNYTEQNGAASIGAASGATCPAFDIAGTARPIAACDAGAYER